MISDITLEEVKEAIDSTARNKSPGLDGITNELYKKQSEIMAPILVEIFNYQLTNLQLLPSNLTGATRLISKAQGNVARLVTEL